MQHLRGGLAPPCEKAFIYGIDVGDTVKDIGVEIDQNSLTLTEQYIHQIFVTVTASVILPFLKLLKFCFEHSVVSQKRNKCPVTNKRPPLRYQK